MGNSNINLFEKEKFVNYVWNWRIYNPKNSIPSITIPDVLPIEYPELFKSNLVKSTKESIIFAKNKAQFIFCISHHVKERLINISNIDSNRIKVIYPGVSDNYFKILPNELKNKILKKYYLYNKGYIISSGFLDPRKNLVRQINGFALFEKKYNLNLKYVLTGLDNNSKKEIYKKIQELNLENKVLFLGYVGSEELRALIQCSLCVLYCSLAEGFGLPIIEAMASRVPFVTSNTTSMKEIGAGYGELVNPYNIEEIANGIEKVTLLNDKEREIIVNGNRIYSEKFTTKNWLDGHLNEYLKL